MPTFRSLATSARPLSRRAALVLAGLALSLALIVGSSPAHAAGRPAAAPLQTTKAPPVISSAQTRALASKLDRSLSKLGKHPTVGQLKALGLRPDPKQMAADFNKLAHSTRARAATEGSTYWLTYQYYGHFWADVYYSGPYVAITDGTTFYVVYSNYKICDWQGNNCNDLNVYTFVGNYDIDGHYYFDAGLASGFTLDSAGMPEYGYGPYTG
jgi:hypothetical protein